MFGLWCSFASTGILHWKVVSVYINRMGLVNESLLHAVQLWLRQFSDDVLLKGKNVALQVMVKMKSRHVAGTITKKKKSKQAAAKQPRMA